MRKPHMIIALVIGTLFSLTSCGSMKTNTPAAFPQHTDSAASGETTRQATVVMGFAQVGNEGGWRKANSKSIRESAEASGIRLLFTDSGQNQVDQIRALRSYILQKVDVIAFSPIVESGWDEVLSEVKAAGIPVILTDRAIDSQDTSLYVTFLGSDFIEEGRKAGKWLLDATRNDDSGTIHIAELQGTIGSAPTNDRCKGFREVIGHDPKFKIEYSKSGEFTRAKGKIVMREFLAEAKRDNTPIDVLFSHNDDMTLGAIEAMEEAGLKPGKDMLVITFDGIKEAFEAMAENKINVIIECNPLLGDQLMQAALDIVDGKTLPKRIVTREGVYTQNMAEKEVSNRKY